MCLEHILIFSWRFLYWTILDSCSKDLKFLYNVGYFKHCEIYVTKKFCKILMTSFAYFDVGHHSGILKFLHSKNYLKCFVQDLV